MLYDSDQFLRVQKKKYYDLFRQGHSPSSAHLEYETKLTYKDTQLLADRHINPKISDVYNLFNKWRKPNLGVRTGKQIFTELEHRASIYNDSNNHTGGKTKENTNNETLVRNVLRINFNVHVYC